MDRASLFLTKNDPVEYRLRHLRDERLEGVLTAAANAAATGSRAPLPPSASLASSPAAASPALPTKAATTAIVRRLSKPEVDQNSGQVKVRRVFTAVDCGPISNPDGLRNQCEGGTLQGMSRALLEEATWDEQKVTSVNSDELPRSPLQLRAARNERGPAKSSRRRSYRRGRVVHYRYLFRPLAMPSSTQPVHAFVSCPLRPFESRPHWAHSRAIMNLFRSRCPGRHALDSYLKNILFFSISFFSHQSLPHALRSKEQLANASA